MPIGLLNKLIFGAKRVALFLKEKPAVNIDDYVLEHMLFYHGLTGSSPQNNKETKIVKADIKEALERKSCSELALALKLPPTLWEERLQNIITSMHKDEQNLLVSLLLPKSGETAALANSVNKVCSLNHEDWQVRANAANILAFLNAKEAVEDLALILSNDTPGNTMSFCYVAYALGQLQGERAKEALAAHMDNSESWLRIDASGALAFFDFDIVCQLLCKSLLQEQEALDYLAYAISRKHKPMLFLQTNSLPATKAGAQLISGLMEAAQNSFNRELIIESETHLCLPILIKLAQNSSDPLIVEVAISLCEWLPDSLTELEEQKKAIYDIANSDDFRKTILAVLEKATTNLPHLDVADLSSTIKLAGRLNLEESQPLLHMLLSKCRALLSDSQINNIIVALGKISAHADSTSTLLINYARELFNVQERCSLVKSKQPVFEENTAEAKIYWQILKTLGNIPTEASIAFLFQALTDYAPDKRSCALESLSANFKKNTDIKLPQSIDNILQEALKDPAAMMQLAALDNIAQLNRANLIKDILPLIDARENTVSKHALASLDHLAKSGNSAAVKAILNEKIKTIREEHKKRRIMDILQQEY